MADDHWEDEWHNRVSELDKEIARGSLPIDTMIGRLRELRTEAADHGVGEDFLTAVDRNFAQKVFIQAMTRNCSLDQCRRYFAAVCDAGFFHIAHKCQFHEYFATYCAEFGQKIEGLEILRRLKAEVERLPGEAESAAWSKRAELQQIDARISDIEADRLPAIWSGPENRQA
jgi:hypothetical protein